jgi:hypothetical protein
MGLTDCSNLCDSDAQQRHKVFRDSHDCARSVVGVSHWPGHGKTVAVGAVTTATGKPVGRIGLGATVHSGNIILDIASKLGQDMREQPVLGWPCSFPVY